VKEEVKKRAEYAASHIYFATASYVLLKKSNKGLDDVVSLLKADPSLRLSVDGYTDNTGKPEKNQLLSEQRAGSVKNIWSPKESMTAGSLLPATVLRTLFQITRPLRAAPATEESN